MKNNLLLNLISALLLINFSANSQDYQDYKFMHPKPQANLLRKIQMIDANTWFAVGANGTFMRTTNAGVDWYFHHQAGKYANSGQAIGQNYDLWFFNASTGIVVGETGYVGRTINGGTSFQAVDAGIVPTSQRGQSVWFADQNVGFAAFGSGSGFAGTLIKTTDGGLTWSVMFSAPNSVLTVSGTSSQNVFAVASDGTVFKTTNGGTNWTSTLSVGQFMYGMSFLNSTTGFICGSSGGLYRTTDGGNVWTALPPPQVDWACFQIKIISATEIYVVGDPVYLWKTTDLGNTWTSSSIIAVSGPASTYIWYSMDKVGSTMVLSGDFGVVAKSTNSGTSWSANQFSYSTQIMFDFATVPGSSNVWAVGRQYSLNGGDRNVMFSSDGGSNWVTYNTGEVTDLNAISMVTPTIGYACGTNSVVLKTTNAGQTWIPKTKPSTTDYTLYDMEFLNENTGWVVVNFGSAPGGNIFKTTDGGTSWIQQTIGTNASLAGIDMVNANVGYINLNPSGNPIYKTTDGGNVWSPVTIPFTGQIRALKAIDENLVYIGTTAGTNRIAKTTNGGTTWTPFALPVTVDVNSMDFKDANIGYVTGNLNSIVCRTSDGGNTWSFQNVHLPTLAKVHVNSGDTVFVSGTYTSILRATNFAVPVEMSAFTVNVKNSNVHLSWTTATEKNNMGFDIERSVINPHSSVGNSEYVKVGYVEGHGTSTENHSYSFTDKNLTQGKYSYRLRQIDFDGSYTYHNLSEVIEIGLPGKFELSQNYPNPFNPVTNIKFSLTKQSVVKLEIYNSIGEVVGLLLNEVKAPGSYEIPFDAGKLSSGVYLYKLSSGEGSLIKKMTVVK